MLADVTYMSNSAYLIVSEFSIAPTENNDFHTHMPLPQISLPMILKLLIYFEYPLVAEEE